MNDESDAVLMAWSQFLGTHARVLRAMEASLRAADLPSMGWYDVLLELDRVGGRRRVGELADALVIEPYNMTRLLDRLETAGLLSREKAPNDRRGAVAVLTEEGRALRRRMWPHYRRAIREIFGASLAERDARSLARILKGIDACLDAGSPQSSKP